MQTITLTAPSHWATYLFYGDDSGLSHEDIKSCDLWCRAMGIGNANCVDAIDAGFCHIHDATNGQYSLAADCQLYTFIID